MEEVKVSGWKGESGLEIKDQDTNFLLIEYRQSKTTGEVVENKHLILRENVEALWSIILEHLPIGGVYTSKYLARKLIQKHGWHTEEGLTEDIMMSALWGGKFRAKYYFPFLYHPLKILEQKGYIAYSGRGSVVRYSNKTEIR